MSMSKDVDMFFVFLYIIFIHRRYVMNNTMNHIKIEKYGNTADNIEFNYVDINSNDWTIYVTVNNVDLKVDSYGVEGSEWIEVDEDTLDYSLEVVNCCGETLELSEDEKEYVHGEIISFLLEELC